MRFSIYGRYELDIERREGRWVVFRRGRGTRRQRDRIFVPAELHEDELVRHLDDLLHEEAIPADPSAGSADPSATRTALLGGSAEACARA